MGRPRKMTIESAPKTSIPVDLDGGENLDVQKDLHDEKDEKTSRIMWEMSYLLSGKEPENGLSDGMVLLKKAIDDVLMKARETRVICAYPEPDVITLDHMKVGAFYALAKEVYTLYRNRGEDGTYPFDYNQPLVLVILYELARMLNGMTEPAKTQDEYLQYAVEGIYLIENMMLYSNVENSL